MQHLLRRSLSSSSTAGLTLSKKVELPKLPYAYDALAPVLSPELMELHHSKHHQAYVTNYNASIEKQEEALKKNDVAGIISLQNAIRFNGGGHINHSIFWTNLAPVGKGGSPSAPLNKAIEARWGNMDAFKADFNAKAAGVQGSGWAWLAFDAGWVCPAGLATEADDD